MGAAALLFLLQAWHRYPIVASVEGGRFDDPDAMHHARRAARAVSEGSVLPPVFDPLVAFPTGSRELWPPLHDASLALAARLGGSTRSQPSRGLVLAGAVPVVEGLAALLVVAWLAAQAGGRAAAAPAAWLFATTPMLARRASYGEIDHNVTEVLAALLLFAVAGWAVRAKRLAAGAAAWTAAVLVALGLYAGLVLSAGIVAGAFLLVAVRAPERRADRAATLALGFALAAALLPFFAALRVKPDPSDPWRLGPVYVLALSTGAIGCGAAALLFARADGGARPAGMSALAGIAGGILVAALQPSAAFGAFAKAFSFLGSRDPWLATIIEFQPLWPNPRELSKGMPALLAGAVAVCALVWMWRRAREKESLLPLAALAVPSASLTLLALVQTRFVSPAAAFACAFAGATWIATRASRPWRLAHRAALVLGAAWGAWFLLAMLDATFHGSEKPPQDPSLGEQAVLALKIAAGGSVSTDAGVLAPWSAGHHLVRAGWPAVLTPFGSGVPGFREGLAVYLEESPARAVAALEALRVRWVVVEAPPDSLLDAALPLGRDARVYFEGAGLDVLSSAGARTFAARLYRRTPPQPGDTDADRLALARLRPAVDGTRPRQTAEGQRLPGFRLFELR